MSNARADVLVALLQTDVDAGQPALTRSRAAELMASAGGADLYVLPEMFATGFTMQPELWAEDFGASATLAWMRGQAAARGAAVAGSIAVGDGGRFFNRLCLVAPSGEVTAYDKRHLFAYAGEDKHYERGTRRVVARVGGLRLLLTTCYDLRFPAWCRNRGDYDALLCVASWPDSRIGAWNALLRARAIENQCYAIGVNRVGRDATGAYSGHSAAYRFDGEPLALAAGGGEQATMCGLDLDSLRTYRERFPFLRDADRFSLLP